MSLGVEFLTDDPAYCSPNESGVVGLGQVDTTSRIAPWTDSSCDSVWPTLIEPLSQSSTTAEFSYELNLNSQSCAIDAVILNVKDLDGTTYKQYPNEMTLSIDSVFKTVTISYAPVCYQSYLIKFSLHKKTDFVPG